jgi:hypothetical protein
VGRDDSDGVRDDSDGARDDSDGVRDDSDGARDDSDGVRGTAPKDSAAGGRRRDAEQLAAIGKALNTAVGRPWTLAWCDGAAPLGRSQSARV